MPPNVQSASQKPRKTISPHDRRGRNRTTNVSPSSWMREPGDGGGATCILTLIEARRDVSRIARPRERDARRLRALRRPEYARPVVSATARVGRDVLAAIGSTPLVRLRHCVPENGAELWLKLECLNPTGSM